MHLPQHKLCARKTEFALEMKVYIAMATNADRRKWRQIRIFVVSVPSGNIHGMVFNLRFSLFVLLLWLLFLFLLLFGNLGTVLHCYLRELLRRGPWWRWVAFIRRLISSTERKIAIEWINWGRADQHEAVNEKSVEENKERWPCKDGRERTE